MFPEVGSIIVSPGFSFPDFSALSIMLREALSFTEPPGLKLSSFTQRFLAFVFLMWFSCMIGVLPIVSRMFL